jgi:Protein of unknown function (DUF3592)
MDEWIVMANPDSALILCYIALDFEGRMPLLVLIVAIIALFRVLAWNYAKTLLANGWYQVQGTAELGSVQEHEIRFVSYYVARIDYSYSVGNEYFSGCFERTFLRESSADRFVNNLKGQPIVVRHHPHRPERSALLRQDQLSGRAS